MLKHIVCFILVLTACETNAQGVNPITPPPNWLVPTLDPAFANPSQYYTTIPRISAGTSLSLTCDGATDNTAAIVAAETAMAAVGGGRINASCAGNITGGAMTGTFTHYTNVHLVCSGPEAVVFTLKNGVNAPIFQTYQFSSLTGTNSAEGVGDWTLSYCAFNGNAANNSTYLVKPVIRVPGTGYTAGTYPITVGAGFTCATAPTVTFTVSGGVPNAVTGFTPGLCSKPPAGDVTVTGGGGSNLALTLGWSACIQVYGYHYRIEWLNIRNCAGGGVYSEWSTTAGCPLLPPAATAAPNCMEAFITHTEVHSNQGSGWFFSGPHDSMLADNISYQNGGDDFTMDSGQIQIVNFHGFGAVNGWELNGLGPAIITGSVFEGGHIGNIYIGYQKTSIIGGSTYNCNGDGVRIGEVGVAPGFTTISGFALPDGCQIDFKNDAGGDSIDVLTTAGTPYIGTVPDGNSRICNQVQCSVGGTLYVRNGASFYGGLQMSSGSVLCLFSGNLVSPSCRMTFDASGDIVIVGPSTGTPTQCLYLDSSNKIIAAAKSGNC